MIYLYYGKIGDGKTYHVLRQEIIPSLKSGRKIYTNMEGLNARALSLHCSIPLDTVREQLHIFSNKEEILKFCRLELDDSKGDKLRIEKNALVVVDEAQLIWDARDFKNTSKEFLYLLEYHRHFGLDFVFITQNVKRLENAISRLSNECYQVKNLKFLSSFLGKTYVLNVRQTPHDKDIIATSRGHFDSSIFRLYSSMTSGSRVINKSSANVFTSFRFVALFLCIGFCLWSWVSGRGMSIFTGGGNKVKMPEPPKQSAPLTVTKPAPPPPPPQNTETAVPNDLRDAVSVSSATLLTRLNKALPPGCHFETRNSRSWVEYQGKVEHSTKKIRVIVCGDEVMY